MFNDYPPAIPFVVKPPKTLDDWLAWSAGAVGLIGIFGGTLQIAAGGYYLDLIEREYYERDAVARAYEERAERRLSHWRFRLAGWIDDAKARLWGER